MNENNHNQNNIFAQLAAPFHPDDLEWRAGATNGDKTKALALAYITSRAVMDRLDEVLSPENWRDEYKPGPTGGLICGISLRIKDEWITKWDGAENTQFEEVKGGLSGAFKRAAVKWGVGRYLYKLPNVWVPCQAKGKNVVLKETPKLPSWALPNGDRARQILKELGYQETLTTTPAKEKGNGKPNGRNKSWKQDIVQAVIQAKLVATPPEAVQLLNQSEIPGDASPEEAITWLKAHQPV
jgi:hypothetical protein